MQLEKIRTIRSTIRWVMLAIALTTLAAGSARISRAEESSGDVERRLRELEETVKQLKNNPPQPETTSDLSKLSASYKDGFTLATEDGQFKLILRGYLQSDGRFFIDNKSGTNSQFFLRRVRPVLEGTVFKYFDFKLMPDFAGSKTVLFDAYVDVTYFRAARLQIGKYKPPIGLERLQSARHLLFVERGLPTNLVPNRDVGAWLHGDFLNGALSYAAGIFNGVADLGNGDTDNGSDKDFVGRAFALPLKNTTLAALRNFGVGVAGSYGHEHGSASSPALTSGYLTAAQATFFSYIANGSDTTKTAVASGDRTRVSPQGYYFWGPVGLLSEYVDSEQAVSAGGKSGRVRSHAWQAVGSYVLTGENASYDGVSPARPFDPWSGKWGAVQAVARYGTLDVSSNAFNDGFADPAKSAREAREWVIGVNWYLNTNVKFVLNYANTDFKGGAPKGGDRKTEKAILSRLQLAF